MFAFRASVGACALLAGLSASNKARAQAAFDLCSGVSVNLPVLQPVATVSSGLLAGLLDPVLNGIIGNVNLNLHDALSGKNIGLTILDKNGSLVTSGNCRPAVDGLEVNTNKG